MKPTASSSDTSNNATESATDVVSKAKSSQPLPSVQKVHQVKGNEIVVDWKRDGTVACNLTELLKEERDLLARKKKGKQKADIYVEKLLGEYHF